MSTSANTDWGIGAGIIVRTSAGCICHSVECGSVCMNASSADFAAPRNLQTSCAPSTLSLQALSPRSYRSRRGHASSQPCRQCHVEEASEHRRLSRTAVRALQCRMLECPGTCWFDLRCCGVFENYQQPSGLTAGLAWQSGRSRFLQPPFQFCAFSPVSAGWSLLRHVLQKSGPIVLLARFLWGFRRTLGTGGTGGLPVSILPRWLFLFS